MTKLTPEIDVEVFSVSLPHTVSEPGAVMIISRYTLLAQSAVFGSEWLLYVTRSAISQIYNDQTIVTFVLLNDLSSAHAPNNVRFLVTLNLYDLIYLS